MLTQFLITVMNTKRSSAPNGQKSFMQRESSEIKKDRVMNGILWCSSTPYWNTQSYLDPDF